MGDLDTDGFAILARFRARRPCDSLMMDHATLARWRELAVPHPAVELVDTQELTEEELTALEMLHVTAYAWNRNEFPWESPRTRSGVSRTDPDLLKSGGAKGNRTPDLLDANETRYQLRYSPLYR